MSRAVKTALRTVASLRANGLATQSESTLADEVTRTHKALSAARKDLLLTVATSSCGRCADDIPKLVAEAHRLRLENSELQGSLNLAKESTERLVAEVLLRMREKLVAAEAGYARLEKAARAVDDMATRYGVGDETIDLFDLQQTINALRSAFGGAQ